MYPCPRRRKLHILRFQAWPESSLVPLLRLFPRNLRLCGSPFAAGNGEYKDICFPCTKEARTGFDQAVLTAYEQKLAQSQTAARQEAPVPQQGQGQQMAGM